MRFSSLLICAGTAAAGVAVGRFSQPTVIASPSDPPPAESARPDAAAAVPPGAILTSPVEELVTMQSAVAYQAKLEKLSASEVCAELRRVSFYDGLRKDLVKARFLEFPAAERLRALLEPLPPGANPNSGAWNDLYLKTAADMILTDPAGVAKLLNAPDLRLFDGLEPVLEPLFARDGWEISLDFISKLPPQQQAMAKPLLAGLLAAQDLPKAQAECLKIPEGKDRNLLVSAVAKVMADDDPKAALEWAGRHFKVLEHSMGHRPENVVSQILKKIADKDPAKAAALLVENQAAFSGNYGTTEIGELFANWAGTDFKAAEAWLNTNPLGDDLQKAAVRSIYTRQLTNLNEDSAAVSFYQNLPADLQADCAATLLGKVGAKGLPGGLEAFYKNMPQRGRNVFESELRSQMPNLSTEERKQALAIISKGADARAGSGYMLDSALGQVPEAERDELIATLSGPVRDALQAKQAEDALRSGDLEKAKTLLSGLSSTKDVMPHAELAVGLADTDPAAAVAWVEALPEGKARSTAAINLAANWAKADLEAAAKWARDLPPESGRDAALKEIIEVQGLSGQVQPALELAATIRDESTRLTAVAAATRSAWFQNQTTARQLLTSQNLTPEQTQKVIDRIETGNPLR